MGVHNRRIKGSCGALDPFSPGKARLFPENYLSDYLKAPLKAFNMPEVIESLRVGMLSSEVEQKGTLLT